MSTFIAGILAFLLTIFPSCGLLQSRTFPGSTTVMNNIITAIETGNIVALESMMCKYTRENVSNLSGEIDKLLGTIDGEIFDSNWSETGSFDSSANGKISRKSFEIICKTATQTYRFNLTWMIVNTRAPNEIGLRSLTLSDSENNVLSSIYVPSKYF